MFTRSIIMFHHPRLFELVISIANQHPYPLVIKDGNGKWTTYHLSVIFLWNFHWVRGFSSHLWWQRVNPIKSHPKPSFSYGFPMVFLWHPVKPVDFSHHVGLGGISGKATHEDHPGEAEKFVWHICHMPVACGLYIYIYNYNNKNNNDNNNNNSN